MHFVTIADIKRSGMAALDAALISGPAYIMKRNQPVAVVLSEENYTQLLERAQVADSAKKSSAIDLFLAPMPEGSLDRVAVTRRLARSAAEWPER